MKKYFQKLVQYNIWAHTRVIDIFKGILNTPQEVVDLFAHTLQAERLWLMRINKQNTAGMNVFPRKNVDELAEVVKHNSANFHKLIGIPKLDFDTIITYSNSKGLKFTTSIGDILIHVFNHSTYHRAQIAPILRENNITPPVTDYIAMVR